MNKITLVAILSLIFTLSACANAQSTPEPTEAAAVVAEVVVTNTAVSPTIPPTPTQTHLPTVLPTKTSTPTPTLVPSPVPSPTTSLWNKLPTPEVSFVPEVNLIIEDQVGGVVRTVTVNKGIALLGVGPRLWIIDVSDPTNPIKIGQTDILPEIVQDVVWHGEQAYVATKENGFWLIDMKIPGNPQIQQFFELPHLVTDFKIQNDTLLALGKSIYRGSQYDLPDEWGLSLVDIANRESIQIINTIPIDGAVHSWSSVNETIFLMKRGLDVIDISDPQNPKITFIPEIFERAVVAASENELFLVGNQEIKSIDISDPTNPVEIDPGENDVFPGYGIADFELDGQTLLFTGDFCDAGSCGSTLSIHDTSKAGLPELSFTGAGFLSYDLFVQSGYAYIATEDGLNIIDISRPNQIISIGWVPTTGTIHHISAQADRVGGLNRDTYSLYFYPVETPGRPKGPIPFNPPYTDMVEVLLNGDDTYLSTGIGNAWGDLQILNTADMWKPAITGIYQPEEYTSGVRETIVQGNYAYTLLTSITREHGDIPTDMFAIIDVSNSENPYRIGSLYIDIIDNEKELAIANDIAYVTTKSQLIAILVADPSSPQVIGELDLGEDAILMDIVAVPNGVLLLWIDASSDEQALLLIETTDVNDMHVLSKVTIPDNVNNLTFEYPYAFVSGAKLWVVDISDPEALRIVGASATPGSLQKVVVQDGIIYAADGDGGLLVLKLEE